VKCPEKVILSILTSRYQGRSDGKARTLDQASYHYCDPAGD